MEVIVTAIGACLLSLQLWILRLLRLQREPVSTIDLEQASPVRCRNHRGQNLNQSDAVAAVHFVADETKRRLRIIGSQPDGG